MNGLLLALLGLEISLQEKFIQHNTILDVKLLQTSCVISWQYDPMLRLVCSGMSNTVLVLFQIHRNTNDLT